MLELFIIKEYINDNSYFWRRHGHLKKASLNELTQALEQEGYSGFLLVENRNKIAVSIEEKTV